MLAGESISDSHVTATEYHQLSLALNLAAEGHCSQAL